MKTIDIGREYSDTPLGRYYTDGPFSGERFREELLVPALKSGEPVAVDLDSVEGCGSSFLDEAFGGLVRKSHYTPQELKKNLSIVCTRTELQLYTNLIWKYINSSKPS